MPSKHRDRIAEIRAAADRDAAAFEPPADPPDEDAAMAYLRDGFGEAVAVYVDARSEDWDRFGEAEFRELEAAMNTYLDLYAACYGVEMDADVTVREAAEALIDTGNIDDVARILTGVPDR